MKLTRRYEGGVVVPWWDGLVRHDFLRREVVCCLIPFNVILRLGWRIWMWMIRPFASIERFQRARWQREHADLIAQFARERTKWTQEYEQHRQTLLAWQDRASRAEHQVSKFGEAMAKLQAAQTRPIVITKDVLDG